MQSKMTSPALASDCASSAAVMPPLLTHRIGRVDFGHHRDVYVCRCRVQLDRRALLVKAKLAPQPSSERRVVIDGGHDAAPGGSRGRLLSSKGEVDLARKNIEESAAGPEPGARLLSLCEQSA